MEFLGLKEDCESLLSRFQATDSVRYEEFLAIWKEMRFFTIFHGGMRGLESNRFSREAFLVVANYFLPPYTFQIRVGALYLLYGLYNTQLCQPKQKIRIALKDWPEVESFHLDLVKAQHLDAVYVFRALRRGRAFYFTAMPTLLTFKSQKSIPIDDGKEEFKDTRDRVADLITSDTLEEIINVHEHYQKTKFIVSSDKSQMDRSLSLIREEFTDTLDSLVTEYQQWKQDKQIPRTKSDSDKEGSSQESESSERARHLAKIKSKTYSAVTQAVKSRRHRQVKMASSESSSDHCEATSDHCEKKPQTETKRMKELKRKMAREAQKQTYLALTQKKPANMPSIAEEASSSNNEESSVPKKRRKR